MAYTKTTWNNDAPPAINAENLNKIEQGIYDNDQNKVDKVSGKGLSQNDFTDALKTKLDGIEAQANKTVVDSALSDSSTNPVQNKAITAEITDLKEDLEENYASIDGYYEEMTVGDAEQLVATQFVNDSEPYNFRTTGGSADVGNREYLDAIVGGTVAWNQLVYTAKGNASSVTVSGRKYVVTADGNQPYFGASFYKSSSEPLAVEIGHKFFASANIETLSITNFQRAYFAGVSVTNFFTTGRAEAIVTSNSARIGFNARTSNATTSTTDTFTVSDLMLFDLTAMFGSTIADYIYSLEQATAGAGVAYFKSLFGDKYHPYDAGSLKSVEGVSAHVTTGFNQWDEEWELGTIYEPSGSNGNADDRIRSKNYIPILPNATYYVKGSAKTFYYDADKNYLGFQNTKTNTTFVTLENAHFMRFLYSGTTYNNDICINLSDPERNGEYEPYVKHSYPLDNSLTLRGIPKLDASNNLYYDGDTYESDGTVTRKYGVVDLGTLNWAYYSNYQMFYANVVGKKAGTGNLLCSKYRTTDAIFTVSNDKAVGGNGSNNTCYVRDSSFNQDAAAFKTAMSGAYFVYELATPTTETADPYNNVQICDDFGTEEFVTDSIVPVGHETRYPANLRDKLQHLPDLADADGYYMIGQSNKQMHLELFRIPTAPSTDGTYTLTLTVSGGVPTYSWE